MTDTLPAWHPHRFARRKENLATRQKVLAALRGYFTGDGFAEVDTSILQVSPGNEVHLQTFATQLKSPRPDEAPRMLHLHTSPEFAMKKLLVAGMPKIFQFAHVFRNGERSSRHHPEFTMLEWYRSFEKISSFHAGEGKNDGLSAIKQDCIQIIRTAIMVSGRKTFSANGMVCDPFAEWQSLSIPAAFRDYAGIDLMATIDDPREPLLGKLAEAATRAGIRVARGDRWDDIFFRVLSEKIEPFLGKDAPCFLCDYPVNQAALARPKADDPRLAERFELYICGIELANAFDELTDADEQARRFKADMDLKEQLYGERVPVDDDFIAALRHGMPDSAGIALGFDRLVMLCTGVECIDDVLWLPVA